MRSNPENDTITEHGDSWYLRGGSTGIKCIRLNNSKFGSHLKLFNEAEDWVEY